MEACFEGDSGARDDRLALRRGATSGECEGLLRLLCTRVERRDSVHEPSMKAGSSSGIMSCGSGDMFFRLLVRGV